MALSKPRTSSHNLEIERGRYTRLQLNVDQRICMSCNVLEDKEHFLLHWQDNWVERELFVSVLKNSSYFFNQSSSEQFVCLMRCPDPQIVAWFGKFIHHSYLNRDIIRYNARTCWRQGIVFLCVFFRRWRQRLMICSAVSEEGAAGSWRTVICPREYVSISFSLGPCSNMLICWA